MRCIPPGEKPVQLQVTIIDDDEGKVHRSNDTWEDPDSNGTVFINVSNSNILEPYRKYNAMITAKNDFGESESTGEISFSKSPCMSLFQGVLEIPCV